MPWEGGLKKGFRGSNSEAKNGSKSSHERGVEGKREFVTTYSPAVVNNRGLAGFCFDLLGAAGA